MSELRPQVTPKIAFFVPGNPQAQKRHRTFTPKGGKFPVRWDASKGDKADFLAKCMQRRPEKPFAGPVALHITACFPRVGKKVKSKYYTKKKMDWDNIGKFVSDALNGIFYLDDSQIVDGRVERLYTDCGQPGINIIIEEIEKCPI